MKKASSRTLFHPFDNAWPEDSKVANSHNQFTLSQYVSLLTAAKKCFIFSPFTDIPLDTEFALRWHDVDCAHPNSPLR